MIGGMGFIASGIAAVVVGTLLSNIDVFSSAEISTALILLGIAYFVVTHGVWKGKEWAWTITLVLSSIGILLNLVSIVTGNIGAIFGIVINAVVIYYLFRPNVKMFFSGITSASSSYTSSGVTENKI
jgi:uncharacterized membrane protein (DUF2068 family)